jgi:hypothetical protein
MWRRQTARRSYIIGGSARWVEISAPTTPFRSPGLIRAGNFVFPYYAHQLIDGVAVDLHIRSYHNFAALTEYCYGVASTVGLMSMFIVGFYSEHAIRYAVKLGVALQLTNILRDIAEDWKQGRLYLPQDELRAFGVSDNHLQHGIVDDSWRALMKFQIDRARRIYAEAWPGLAVLHPSGRLAIAAAATFYKDILSDIEARDYDVFRGRARVSKWGKIQRLPQLWYAHGMPVKREIPSLQNSGFHEKNKKEIVVIGAGFGGLSAAIRLISAVHAVTLYDKRDKPGGRGYQYEIDGFKFDGGPTVITAPYMFDELFALGGRNREDYFDLIALDPFYRIFNEQGEAYNYYRDLEQAKSEVARFSPGDVDGFARFVNSTVEVFKRFHPYTEKPFLKFSDMLKIMPDMFKTGTYLPMYHYAANLAGKNAPPKFEEATFSLHQAIFSLDIKVNY